MDTDVGVGIPAINAKLTVRVKECDDARLSGVDALSVTLNSKV
jgi:hypothetical protein